MSKCGVVAFLLAVVNNKQAAIDSGHDQRSPKLSTKLFSSMLVHCEKLCAFFLIIHAIFVQGVLTLFRLLRRFFLTLLLYN